MQGARRKRLLPKVRAGPDLQVEGNAVAWHGCHTVPELISWILTYKQGNASNRNRVSVVYSPVWKAQSSSVILTDITGWGYLPGSNIFSILFLKCQEMVSFLIPQKLPQRGHIYQ